MRECGRDPECHSLSVGEGARASVRPFRMCSGFSQDLCDGYEKLCGVAHKVCTARRGCVVVFEKVFVLICAVGAPVKYVRLLC